MLSHDLPGVCLRCGDTLQDRFFRTCSQEAFDKFMEDPNRYFSAHAQNNPSLPVQRPRRLSEAEVQVLLATLVVSFPPFLF